MSEITRAELDSAGFANQQRMLLHLLDQPEVRRLSWKTLRPGRQQIAECIGQKYEARDPGARVEVVDQATINISQVGESHVHLGSTHPLRDITPAAVSGVIASSADNHEQHKGCVPREFQFNQAGMCVGGLPLSTCTRALPPGDSQRHRDSQDRTDRLHPGSGDLAPKALGILKDRSGDAYAYRHDRGAEKRLLTLVHAGTTAQLEAFANG